MVTKVSVVEGATATQGMELFTLQNTDKVDVNVNVSKYDYDKVKEGQSADITIAGKIYEGEVLKDYRELVDRYKTRYANNIAFEYKKEVHDKEHIKITYAEFARDIEALGPGLLTLDFINKRVA